MKKKCIMRSFKPDEKKKNWSVSCSKVQTLNSVIYQLNFEILWKCIGYAIV